MITLHQTHRWFKTRNKVMKRDRELCQPCLRKDIYAIATQVDHIKSQHDHEDINFYDESNLEAICTPCHILKTVEENTNRKNKYKLEQIDKLYI